MSTSKQHKSGDFHFIHLITERLRIRRFDVADVESIALYRSRPSVARYQSWTTYTLDDAQKLYREMKTRHPGQIGYWFQFALSHSETGQMIGDCGLRVSSADPEQAEIGFTIDSKFQGQGYGAEAVHALVVYCFEELGLRRLTATTDVNNIASARMLEKVGFRQEAHFVENVVFKGKIGSEYQYAMLAREIGAAKKRVAQMPKQLKKIARRKYKR